MEFGVRRARVSFHSDTILYEMSQLQAGGAQAADWLLLVHVVALSEYVAVLQFDFDSNCQM